MKNKLILIFLILISLQGYTQSSRAKAVTLRTDFWEYKAFTSFGTYQNNKKHGVWKDVTSEGVVYGESEYREGIPIGTWKVYSALGILRHVTIYDSYGNILKWTSFDLNGLKHIDIIGDPHINPSLLSIVLIFEKIVYSSKTKTTIDYPSGLYFKASGGTILFPYLKNTLEEMKFTGTSTLFENGKRNRPSIKYFYTSGTETKKHYYNYSGKRLKSISVYQYDIFVGKTYYDKKGNVKKVIKAKAFQG